MENNKLQDTEKEAFSVKFVDPYEIIKNLNITQGMVVADFGCGAGHFSLALAKKIGEAGIVYALDILPEKVGAIAGSAKSQNLSNIIARRANLEKVKGSKLKADSVDLVMIKDMLFQNKGKDIILAEAARILKKSGVAVIIEWKMNNVVLGPDRQLRISKEALMAIAESSGLNMLKEIPAGSFHAGWIFVK